MPIAFTPQQRRVIELHNRNILVSAAAGSGKTAVLVERIIEMICDETKPVDIDRLLIVTFTNAAAAEMRERIANGIAARLSANPESEHIQRQSTLLHNAQITTIDSFSLFIIRNHFNEIGLDPAFRVADEGEIKLLQQETLQQLIEDAYGSKEEAFRYCVEYFCPGGRETVLEQHILNLSRYAASFPWPEQWLIQRKEDYGAGTVEELLASDYGAYLCRHVKDMLEGCVEKLRQVLGLIESPDGPYMYGELVESELARLEKLAESDTLTEYAAGIATVTFGRLPSKKDESVSPLKRELAKSLRSRVKDILSKLGESFFLTPLELAAKQGEACREPVATLIDLVLEFDRRMQVRKQEKKIIDFSDMEHYALNILLERRGNEVVPSSVALEYREYFHEILIDEYQDSNLVQEYLLKAVSGEEQGHYNRFMVGDVKQSIYKFRLARPELFLEKYDTYQEEGDCTRIDLSKNFRSRIQVVDTVNDVFSRIMSKTIGGIAYDHKAALYPGAAYEENPQCASELLVIEKPGKEEKLTSRQAEALAIARRIKGLLGELRVTDKASGSLRPVRFGDMVILLRTTSGWDEVFKKVLEEEGIPAYIASKTGYFAATEVQELLQLLRVLDNPMQDIPLFGVMKSLFGGFTQEEIALVASVKKRESLYETLCRCGGVMPETDEAGAVQAGADGTGPDVAGAVQAGADGIGTDVAGAAQAGTDGTGPDVAGAVQAGADGTGPDGAETNVAESNGAEPDEQELTNLDVVLRERLAGFVRTLERYREYTGYMPIRELLQKLVGDYDYLNYVTAMPGGSKRRANVEMLFTKASDFEKTSYFGLFHFIRYMEQLEKYDVDYGEADTLDENADVVRIMSIHKSKGLEFPVTFVAGLAKRFNMQDANQSLIVDMDLGLATDYVNPQQRIRNKTLRRNVLARKMREDNLSEELRVLYVALTRAREKLIMTATLEKALEKWELLGETGGERLTYIDFIEAGSYLDFLLPILAGTHIESQIILPSQLQGEAVKEQVKLYHKRELLRDAGRLADKEALGELKERFTYEYPHRSLEKLYTKTTVSELKIAAMAQKDEAAYHSFEAKELHPYIPAFRRQEETVSGAARGSAVHRAMELLDFQELLEGMYAAFPEDYETYRQGFDMAQAKQRMHEFLQKEAASLRLSGEYLQILKEDKLVDFLRSEIAYRMWAAWRRGELYREQPFVLGVDAGRLGAEFPGEETVLIQGIIDVFFVENGELVLLDYKTDVIGSMAELWNRYEVQMNYYEEALEKLMQLPVKEKVLYSFYLGEV